MDLLSDPAEKAETTLPASHSTPKLPIVRLNQERVVLAILVVMFLLFSFTLSGFLEVGNLLSLLQNVAVLGILAIGMGLVVIGRGIDLTMVAVMVFAVAWSFALFRAACRFHWPSWWAAHLHCPSEL